MKISKEVEVATLTFMKKLEDLRPRTIEAQEALFNELCKRKDRNMTSVMDLIIEVGEKGCKAAVEYVKDCDAAGGSFVHEQVKAIIRAYKTGDFLELDEFSEEVRRAVLSNHNFNKNLEANTVEHFGKNAMTIAMVEDGLVEEFQRRSTSLMSKV